MPEGKTEACGKDALPPRPQDVHGQSNAAIMAVWRNLMVLDIGLIVLMLLWNPWAAATQIICDVQRALQAFLLDSLQAAHSAEQRVISAAAGLTTPQPTQGATGRHCTPEHGARFLSCLAKLQLGRLSCMQASLLHISKC